LATVAANRPSETAPSPSSVPFTFTILTFFSASWKARRSPKAMSSFATNAYRRSGCRIRRLGGEPGHESQAPSVTIENAQISTGRSTREATDTDSYKQRLEPLVS
jgi:hypothetical protein